MNAARPCDCILCLRGYGPASAASPTTPVVTVTFKDVTTGTVDGHLNLQAAADACRAGKLVECVLDTSRSTNKGMVFRYNESKGRFECEGFGGWTSAEFPNYSNLSAERWYRVVDESTLSCTEAAVACRAGKIVECLSDAAASGNQGLKFRFNNERARFEYTHDNGSTWSLCEFPNYPIKAERKYRVVGG